MSEKKETIPNLLMKKYYQKLTFNNLLKITKQGYNDVEVRDFIFGIKYQEVKDRLIDEAKAYYANLWNCEKEAVYYGNFIEGKQDCSLFNGTFPYAVVVGDVVISDYFKNVKKLKFVAKDLTVSGVTNFENLTVVKNNCDISGSYHKVETSSENMHLRRISLKIPNLTTCSNLTLSDCVVDELNVSRLDFLNIVSSKIKRLNTRYIDKFILSGEIEDAEALDFVRLFKAGNEELSFDIRYLNPNVVIKEIGNVSSFKEGTNKIEEKINSAKTRCENLRKKLKS